MQPWKRRPMPSNGFSILRRSLDEQGVAKRYAERLITELREHRADLEEERLAAGDSVANAARRARQRLGCDAAIVAQVLARPELRGRWSGVRAALFARRPVCAVGAPWSAEALTAPAIARWTASVSLGSLLTVALLLVLARSITLGV